MRRSLRPIITGLSILLLFPGGRPGAAAAAPDAPALDGGAPRVVDVVVKGAHRSGDRDVLNLIAINPGDVWSPVAATEGVRRLYARGIFRDAAIWAAPAEGGVRVWVEVEEKPVIAGVALEGRKEVGKSDLQEQLTLGAGSLWDEGEAQADQRALVEKYRDEGFHHASVEPEVETLEDGRVFIHYRIDEGPKTRVESVQFAGNENVEGDVLRDVMKTRKRKWFSGGDFDEEVFEEDEQRVIAEFRNRGYLDARILDAGKEYDEEGKLTILIRVEEGKQYRVGEVDFEGNEVFGDEELARRVTLAPGGVMSDRDLQSSMEGLYDQYGEQGHVYASIVPHQTRRDSLVDVRFEIDEGEPAHVGRISIAGNMTTREKVIRRELFLVPGDLFRRSALVRSHREIYSLGFFEDVQVRTNVSATGPDIDLVFDVKERQTGQFLAGASYSGEFGLIGSFEMSKTNFRGTGQSVSLKWEFGRLGQIDLSFTEPWFRGTPTSVGFDIFNTRLDRDVYIERSRGGAVRVGRPLPWLDYTRAYLRYKWESWSVRAEGETTADLEERIRFTGEGTASSIQTTFQRNSTDNPFFPTSGSTTRLVSEFSGGYLGGDTGFQKHTLDEQFFLPGWRSTALSLALRVGVISPYRNGQLPLFERFRLGGVGPNGIRGYPDLDVVPRGNDPAEGGRAMFITRAEYRFPITGHQLSGLGFFDAGNVWNKASEAKPAALKRGAGLGFRVEIPGVGTLGFDYGYGFDRGEELGGPGWELHFNIGSSSVF